MGLRFVGIRAGVGGGKAGLGGWGGRQGGGGGGAGARMQGCCCVCACVATRTQSEGEGAVCCVVQPDPRAELRHSGRSKRRAACHAMLERHFVLLRRTFAIHLPT